MPNPEVFPCPADTWVKVATGKTSGVIHRRSNAPGVYRQTYRITTDPAPTDDADAVLFFGDSNSEVFSNSVPIDVYVKAVGQAGSVRADL